MFNQCKKIEISISGSEYIKQIKNSIWFYLYKKLIVVNILFKNIGFFFKESVFFGCLLDFDRKGGEFFSELKFLY